MTRYSNKKSKISLFFLILFCTFAVLGTSLWIALKHGIELDQLNFSAVKMERLSIKADKGIIISVDQLDILTQQTTSSGYNPEFLIVQFNKWAYLFREIRVNQIHHQENTFQLLFKDNQFNISGDKFQLTSTLTYKKGEIHMDISTLELKPYAVTFFGKAIYTQQPGKITFSGGFSSQEVSGDITFSKHQDQVIAEIKTGNFTNLPDILARFPLNKGLITWISENITAKDYTIESLSIDFTLQDGKPDIRPDSITGKAIANNASIRFHSALAPVQCDQIDISFTNNQLSFDLKNPMYKTKSLAGSNVSISNLITDNSQMKINIQMASQLDNEILELLDAYNIHLPFSQLKGITKTDLHLIFNLPDFTLSTNGIFTVEGGELKWRNISFQTNGAIVQLEDNLITLDNTELAYQKMVKASLNGTINLTSQRAAMTADIKQLHLQDEKKDIIKVQNLSTPINIQFGGDEVSIDLPKLQTNITLSPSRRVLTVNKLNEIKPFVPFLQELPLQAGMVNINFTSLENLKFDGFIDTKVLPLSSDEKPITHFTFQGSKTADKLTASINEGKISLAVSDKVLINLHDYLVTADISALGKKAGPSSPVPVSISGSSLLIKLKQISIPTKEFKVDLTGPDVIFKANLNQGNILFQSRNKEINFVASDIDAQIAQGFIPSAELQGGRFNLSLKRKNEENFAGVFEFSNVLFKKLALLNNVFSFINTIPALATLSSPGFDNDGYHVNEGIVHFNYSEKLLTISQLRTDGTTINTEAKGWIDLKEDTLKMDVGLISLKDFSKIINKVPLAGYALLGKDGAINTSLLISGSLTEPKVTTNLSKEIIMSPINVIRRTITWPFKIFDKPENGKNKKPEPDK